MAEGGNSTDAGSTPTTGETVTLPRPDSVTLATGPSYTLREVRWVTTQAYCGDEASLEAVILGYPPSAPATIEIFHVETGNTLDTLHATVNGGRIDATWVAKAPSANWRTDHIKFRFRVPNLRVTGESSNAFTFRQRPTTGWTLINNNHPRMAGSRRGTLPEHHDARLEAGQVHYRVKIRTHGDPFDAAKQQAAKTRIEGVWNGGFSNKKFHRTNCRRRRRCDCRFDCCKASFQLDLNFASSGEHAYIRIVHTAPGAARRGSSMSSGSNRPVTGTWGDPPRNERSTYAHEIGHLIGQYDEYVTSPPGGNDPAGVQPVTPPAGEENLMSTSGNTVLLKRHYRWGLRFLNDHAGGDPYDIIQT